MYRQYSSHKPKPQPQPNLRLNRSQLPSIVKSKKSATASIRSNLQQQQSFDLTSYHQKTNSAIKADSKKLKLEIIDMNKKLSSLVQQTSVWKIKSLQKKELTKEEEEMIIDKEAENVGKMRELYSKEYEQLTERKRMLKDGTKGNNTLYEIMETEEKIMNLKIVLKEMKKKMHTKEKQIVLGNEEKTIVKNGNLLKELEGDYTATQAKISQMKLTMQAIEGKTERLRVSNQASYEEYKKAEELVREMDMKLERDINQEKLSQEYMAKLMQIESGKRRLANVKANGEQKYLTKLKQLETVVELSGYGVKAAEKRLEQSRQTIRELEAILESQQEEISERIREEAERHAESMKKPESDVKGRLSIRLHNQEEEARKEDKQIAEQHQQQQQEQIHHEDEQQNLSHHSQQNKQNITHISQPQLAKDQPSDQPPNSMFLTMPQQSKQNTVYKSPSKRKDQPSENLQSNRTISLRNTQPETKERILKKEVINTVNKASIAIKSVENLFRNAEIEPEEEERYGEGEQQEGEEKK